MTVSFKVFPMDGEDLDISSDFGLACLAELQTVLAKVSVAESIPAAEKRQLCASAFALMRDLETRATPKIPTTAPKLWNDHKHEEKYGGNPYVFAHEVYKDAAKIMIMSDFKRIDLPLHNAMYRWAGKHGRPPVHLDIARQAERLKSGDTSGQMITWNDILASADPQTRALLRAYYAQQSRSRSRRESSP